MQLNSDNTMFELESDPLSWSGSEHSSLDVSPSHTMSKKITLYGDQSLILDLGHAKFINSYIFFQ